MLSISITNLTKKAFFYWQLVPSYCMFWCSIFMSSLRGPFQTAAHVLHMSRIKIRIKTDPNLLILAGLIQKLKLIH